MKYLKQADNIITYWLHHRTQWTPALCYSSDRSRYSIRRYIAWIHCYLYVQMVCVWAQDAQWTAVSLQSMHCFSCYDFPKPAALSGSSVENREARDRGQGAARNSPRCLNAPRMKTKNWWRSIAKELLSVNFSKSLMLFSFSRVLLGVNCSWTCRWADGGAGFLISGHQKIEMCWRHAGNYHGAAFNLVAWNSHIKAWIHESIVATLLTEQNLYD